MRRDLYPVLRRCRLGTLADSFAAIEQRIVREKKLTFEELEETLRNNFAGDERTRLMLSQSERYCQGGDSWATNGRSGLPVISRKS